MSQPKLPKILGIDIETAPHTAFVWGLFNQNIGLPQIRETGRTLCFSWKWLRGGDTKAIGYISELDGREAMLKKAHELLDEADIVVTYNGKKFDVPTLNKEFLEAELPPPSPSQQVDLYRVVKANFRFASNKMDHVAKQLGVATKVRHCGFSLWVRCMEGDKKAWEKMKRYNKRDVLILDKLYTKLLPWIKGHPNVTLFGNEGDTETKPKRHSCPQCGSSKVQRRGVSVTRTSTFARYHCQSCRSWSRERLRLEVQGPKLVQAVH